MNQERDERVRVEWVKGMTMDQVKRDLIESCFRKLQNKMHVSRELDIAIRTVRYWLKNKKQ